MVLLVPIKTTVLVDGVKVPLFDQLPPRVNVYVLAASVAPLLMVKFPLIDKDAPSVFALLEPFVTIRFP